MTVMSLCTGRSDEGLFGPPADDHAGRGVQEAGERAGVELDLDDEGSAGSDRGTRTGAGQKVPQANPDRASASERPSLPTSLTSAPGLP